MNIYGYSNENYHEPFGTDGRAKGPYAVSRTSEKVTYKSPGKKLSNFYVRKMETNYLLTGSKSVAEVPGRVTFSDEYSGISGLVKGDTTTGKLVGLHPR